MSYTNSTNTQSNQNLENRNTSANLTPEQLALLRSQTNFSTGTYNPALGGVVSNAQNQYQQGLGSVIGASNNYGSAANDYGNALGNIGLSASYAANSGLGNILNNDYLQNQINAATDASNLQYQQNLANQSALFGGAGNLGSSRNALANRQLAESQRLNTAQIGANIQNNVANQQIQAAQGLGQIGSDNTKQSLGAYKSAVEASSLPLNYTKQFGDIIYGVPQGVSNPNFSGTQGQNYNSVTGQYQTTSDKKTQIGGTGGSTAGADLAATWKTFTDSGLVDVGKDLYNDFKNWWNRPSTPSTPSSYYNDRTIQ